MTNRHFDFDEDLLECCAQSRVVQFLFAVERHDTSVDGSFASTIHSESDPDRGYEESRRSTSSCCADLFDQHSRHYGRQHSVHESLLLEHPVLPDQFELGNRMDAFLRSVHYVYQHNNKNDVHKVALNRFSDLHPNEIFSTASTPTTRTDPIHNLWGERSLRHYRRHLMEANALDIPFPITTADSSSSTTDRNSGVTVLLSTPEQILWVAANLTIGKGSLNKLYKYRKEEKHNAQAYNLYPVTIDIPTDNQLPLNDENNFAATPALTPDMDGALLSINKNKNVPPKTSKKTSDSKFVDHDTDAVQPASKTFRKHLNWATHNNPDGVPIVNEPFDQVRSFTYFSAKRLCCCCCSVLTHCSS